MPTPLSIANLLPEPLMASSMSWPCNPVLGTTENSAGISSMYFCWVCTQAGLTVNNNRQSLQVADFISHHGWEIRKKCSKLQGSPSPHQTTHTYAPLQFSKGKHYSPGWNAECYRKRSCGNISSFECFTKRGLSLQSWQQLLETLAQKTNILNVNPSSTSPGKIYRCHGPINQPTGEDTNPN